MSNQIEAVAEAIRDAVRINIRPGGETMRLLDKGHTFHLTPDEADTAARAALNAGHHTITTTKELDALPKGTLYLAGECVYRSYGERYDDLNLDEGELYGPTDVELPATVLHWGNK